MYLPRHLCVDNAVCLLVKANHWLFKEARNVALSRLLDATKLDDGEELMHAMGRAP